ncbi:MAG: hypothetical protein VX877_06265 [Planctomycetota bacterium]|nr:hypothetical protein [Planctomycetota bacterium]
MTEWYDDDGVRFAFPESWELTREDEEPGVVMLSVTGDGTSFWTLALYTGVTAASQLIETAVDAYREEYEEVDVYPVEGSLCVFPCEGCDVEFVCLELINTASLRAFETPGFAAVVLYQGTDHELRETRSVLEAITSSLSLTFPGFPEPVR